MSVTHKRCTALGHDQRPAPDAAAPRTRHSPNGVDVIEECAACKMAWMTHGLSGQIVRLYGVIEQRLHAKAKA